MSGFILFAVITLLFVILYQIAKASELAAVLRGEAKSQAQTNRMIGWSMLAMLAVGFYGIWFCHEILKDKMLPVAATQSGEQYDRMFNVTLLVTGIVFIITQVLLFWFAFRYQSTETRKAFYYAHNNRLEIIWTTIPAIVMAILVAIGLRDWFAVTSEAPADAAVVEVVGKQFNWLVRYPGKDKELGKRNFRLISDANNVMGLDTNDKANRDDIVLENGELHLEVGRPVKIIIGSRDVIHDVGLPHFRLKMDAVPGITTTLWFTPKYTTEQMREMTGNPNFVYEIACDQMCGKGHYSMRGTIVVETRAKHQAWLLMQKPYLSGATVSPGTPGGTENAAPADSTTSQPGTTAMN